MKIQNGSGSLVPLDLTRMKGTERAEIANSKKVKEGSQAKASDTVRTEVSRRLKDTLDLISEAGLTAGEVHSNVDESRVMGLLKSMDVEAQRPKLDVESLMNLADKVSEDMQNNPEQAQEAFNPLDPSRIADLL